MEAYGVLLGALCDGHHEHPVSSATSPAAASVPSSLDASAGTSPAAVDCEGWSSAGRRLTTERLPRARRDASWDRQCPLCRAVGASRRMHRALEMTTPTGPLSPSHPRDGTGNVGKRRVSLRRRRPARDDIQRSDQHSSTRLLIRRFGVRIPGGPRTKPQVDGRFQIR